MDKETILTKIGLMISKNEYTYTRGLELDDWEMQNTAKAVIAALEEIEVMVEQLED